MFSDIVRGRAIQDAAPIVRAESSRWLLYQSLCVPRKQLDSVIQPTGAARSLSTAATAQGMLSGDTSVEHSNFQKRSAAAATLPAQRKRSIQAGPEPVQGSVRPASASFTLRSGRTVTGNAALFQPGGLLSGLTQASTSLTSSSPAVLYAMTSAASCRYDCLRRHAKDGDHPNVSNVQWEPIMSLCAWPSSVYVSDLSQSLQSIP